MKKPTWTSARKKPSDGVYDVIVITEEGDAYVTEAEFSDGEWGRFVPHFNGFDYTDEEWAPLEEKVAYWMTLKGREWKGNRNNS